MSFVLIHHLTAVDSCASLRAGYRLSVLRSPSGTHLSDTAAEPLEHGAHVATLLHWDHPHVVLLVNPNQEVLLVVVPESDSQIVSKEFDEIRILETLKPMEMHISIKLRI